MSIVNSERNGGGGLKRATSVFRSKLVCRRCGIIKTVRADRVDPAVGYFCVDCKSVLKSLPEVTP